MSIPEQNPRAPAGDAAAIPASPIFQPVSRTGVIYVTTEAEARGFRTGDADWCNLGQGMPESGPLDGAPDRIDHLAIEPRDQEYAPVAGLWELREVIAGLYNQLYRRGMPSQYSAENVAVSGGGRVAMARVLASLGRINIGHFLPDYTAYAEILEVFRLVAPIPILLDNDQGYVFSIDELRREVTGRGLRALLFSNPCNPTGSIVGGDELAAWVSAAREFDCAMIADEFYSHYVWRPDLIAEGGLFSAARYVEDVDKDPVVILDGLTKNWRYPSWRTAWTIGPKSVIEATTSAASFLDGGGSRPLQRAAIEVVGLERTRKETRAIGQHFAAKRLRMLDALRDMGFAVSVPPQGTFYVWASVENLPPSLSDGMRFFRAALERKVITVPGQFFDVDPGGRRGHRFSRFQRFVRFSFGPAQSEIDRAIPRIRRLIEDAD